MLSQKHGGSCLTKYPSIVTQPKWYIYWTIIIPVNINPCFMFPPSPCLKFAFLWRHCLSILPMRKALPSPTIWSQRVRWSASFLSSLQCDFSPSRYPSPHSSAVHMKPVLFSALWLADLFSLPQTRLTPFTSDFFLAVPLVTSKSMLTFQIPWAHTCFLD